MRRTPIVITSTVAGLAGVLAFHTKPASLTTGGFPSASQSPAPGATASASPGGTSGSPGGTSGSTAKSSSGSGTPAAAGGIRTATGPAVNYSWGVLSVRVTVSGNKITKVAVASLDDGGNSRSQYIDQQSIPMLEQEAMQAQSANIQGVSGASYTSAGFQQSLQAALQSLGFK